MICRASSSSPGEINTRAYEHVKALVEGIGPRPAGSEAERRAQDYVARQLAGWGYRVERLPAPFAPWPRFFPLYAAVGLALAAGSWLMRAYPGFVIGLPLLLVATPTLARWLVRRRPQTSLSENVLAYTDAPADAPTLVFCAHVDSARASAFHGRIWLRLQNETMFIAQRAALLAAALAALHWLGLPLPALLFPGVGLVGSVAGGWLLAVEVWNQAAHRGRYSPGAHDNASGVGVVLALAEHFAAAPPPDLRLGFLFTGAEETGLHGATAFAKTLRVFETLRVSVLNFDMVGAGDTLRFITKEGTLFPQRAAPQLNALVRASRPQAQPLRYTLRSGDFAAFLRQGFAAASLQTSGSARAELAYHTVADTLEVIDAATLATVTQTALDFVGRFQSGRSK